MANLLVKCLTLNTATMKLVVYLADVHSGADALSM